MNLRIDRERLSATFVELCEISTPSRREKPLADHLVRCFTRLGADDIQFDRSGDKTGSDTGNLLVRFAGNAPDIDGLFFSCHMDTVEPGENVRVVRTGDIFTSLGNTILGGDDKSGIAALIEMVEVLREDNSRHGTIELVFTTCEEIGLLGAKHLDSTWLQTRYGYALDSTGTDKVIIGAPAANKLKIDVHGIAAHAGLNPEKGINAFCLAAKAIAELRLGRLDEQSTSNFGLIRGGVATNIVPDLITLEGEVRSHSAAKLEDYTREIETTFRRTVENWKNPFAEHTGFPSVDIRVEKEYPAMRLDESSPVIQRIYQASTRIGRKLEFIVAGGGSDANIFCSHGFPTAIVATGMNKVHTTDECLDLNDLVSLTELLCALATHPGA
ncbi:MAG: M20/M25/M40 family metallo-hydrolase [Desulfobulbaceae bacterium]|nr:MAG: M20/M25/M40 family metallo-hydrolase [Desulfobulbaceae bacterium]